MNRQFRRAQTKQDKRQEREKAKRKAERRARRNAARQGRAVRADTKKDQGKNDQGKNDQGTSDQGKAKQSPPARRKRAPGRFAGILAASTLFFISLQAAVPQEALLLRDRLVGAAFYLMLGYFVVLWLMRRGTPRPVVTTVVGGAFLVLGLEVSKLARAGFEPDLLVLALAVPLTYLGALLGRLVFVRAP